MLLKPDSEMNPIDRVSATPRVNILEGDGGKIRTGICPNKAFKVVFDPSVRVKDASIELLPSHPTNSYPSSGVAVIVTSVPSSYVPPSVETVPPPPAETVRVYCVVAGGSGSGVATTLGGGVVFSSSVEQP